MSPSDEIAKRLQHAASGRTRYDPERHGPRRVVGPGFREQVYDIVMGVPAGAVTTYGDVAGELGLRSVARQVGFALAGLPPDRDDVPWHRVVNARGEVSLRGMGDPSRSQAQLLRDEGVRFDERGRIVAFDALRHRFS